MLSNKQILWKQQFSFSNVIRQIFCINKLVNFDRQEWLHTKVVSCSDNEDSLCQHKKLCTMFKSMFVLFYPLKQDFASENKCNPPTSLVLTEIYHCISFESNDRKINTTFYLLNNISLIEFNHFYITKRLSSLILQVMSLFYVSLSFCQPLHTLMTDHTFDVCILYSSHCFIKY